MTAEVHNTEQARASSTNPVEMRGIERASPTSRCCAASTSPCPAARCARSPAATGAGTSTLMKILQGVHRPDGGTIRHLWREVTFSAPKDAEAAGIGMVKLRWMAIPGHLLAVCWQTMLREGAGVRCAWWS